MQSASTSGTCPQPERGLALLVVLLLASVLLPFIVHFALQIDMESQTALNVKEQLAIDNAIEGQYQIMLSRFEHDGPGNEYDSYEDPWNEAELLERNEEDIDVRIRTRVFDEAGKLPLRALITGSTEEQAIWKRRLIELLKRYRTDTDFDAAGYAEELADEIVRFFQGQNRGQVPKPNTINKSPVMTLDDLHFASPLIEKHQVLVDVRDGSQIGLGLHRYVTVYGEGRVNLNTADRVVLQAMFYAEDTIADGIIDRREGGGEDDTGDAEDDAFADEEDAGAGGNPFTDVNQVNEVEGVDAQSLRASQIVLGRDFDVRSNFFSLRISGSTRNTGRDELYVFERVPGNDPNGEIRGFRHLLCQERTDPLEEVEESLE